MFNISEIIKCEKDIQWNVVPLDIKEKYRIARHKMIQNYEYYVRARNDYITDMENCIINHKVLSKELFNSYWIYLTRFYNSYQIYSLEIYKCKGVK